MIATEHGERLRLDQDAPAEEATSVLTSYPTGIMETWADSMTVDRAGWDAL